MARKYKTKKQHFEPKQDERDNVFEGISEDEVEQFHQDKINFDDEEDSTVSDDLLDDEVLAISSQDEQDMEEALKKVPALRQHMREVQSEDESGDEEQPWGKRRSTFYNDDADQDDQAAVEEEEEAELLHKEKLQQMSEDDFIDDSLGAMIKSGQASAPVEDAGSGSEQEEVVEKQVPDFGHMSQQQIDEFVQHEAPELKALLQEVEVKAQELNDGPATKLLQKMQDTSDGIQLLQVKNHILLNYLLNLTFYFYMRLDGVEGVLESKSHEVVQRLVEYRLFLEKLKPLEAKVRYQVDKLVKAAVATEQDQVVEQQDDPLNYKPSLNNFVVPDAAQDSEDDDGIYKPPRIAPVHYDDDVKSKQERKKDREERRLAQSAAPSRAIMQEMVAEMNDQPEEIHDAGNMFHYNNTMTSSVDRKWQERARAEEELMMRVTTSKKDKKEVRQQKKLVDEMSQLEAFGDFARLKREDDTFDTPAVSKQAQVLSEVEEEEEQYEQDQSEDEYYKELQEEQTSKKELKRKMQEPMEVEYSEEEEMDGKRQIGYDIMKNKGLTPKRSKEQRNPRVKRRLKYERSMKKLKSVKSMPRENTGNYRGEETGIKKNLTRSVKYT